MGSDCHLAQPLRSRCAAVTAQAAALDRLVYTRYGLTAAESKIVEGGDE